MSKFQSFRRSYIADLYCLCFFFKQKTAYEVRISDWSSDVCSSDLDPAAQVDYASLPDHVGYLLRLAQLRVWEDFYARLSATGITPSLYSRTDERRVGKEGVSTWRYRRSP